MVGMLDIENSVLILVMIFVMGFSSFFGFIGTASSVNDTNVTNATNTTNITMASSAVTAMADPTPSTTATNPSVSINITSSVNLSTVVADGSEYPYSSVTQVNVSASEYNSNLPPNWPFYGPSYADDTLNLYTKATGDLVSSLDNISINNLKYSGFSNSSLPKTSFTNDYSKTNTWNIPYSSWDWGYWMSYYSISKSVNGNYYLTVPTGVSSGTYKTTIYYLAILQE